jgi:hypothetical protein
VPAEVVDYELMREMGWSWDELERTPTYIRKYCADLMSIRRRAENAARERAARKPHR